MFIEKVFSLCVDKKMWAAIHFSQSVLFQIISNVISRRQVWKTLNQTKWLVYSIVTCDQLAKYRHVKL